MLKLMDSEKGSNMNRWQQKVATSQITVIIILILIVATVATFCIENESIENRRKNIWGMDYQANTYTH